MDLIINEKIIFSQKFTPKHHFRLQMGTGDLQFDHFRLQNRPKKLPLFVIFEISGGRISRLRIFLEVRFSPIGSPECLL